MSSGSKFARGTGRGKFVSPKNQGPALSRRGQGSAKKATTGQGRDATGYLGAGSEGTATNGREESFQLLADPSSTGRPFAMFIRLQPEILEELKQVEADGIQALMRFGTNASGHEIKVGSESFKFSSAPEPGELCDIYEQKQGDFGEAVLVEAGSAWRKLSVQRILSASEKDRVKKRTAEAEHRQKQRKSILVDPSTQMIIPQAGVADVNGRKPGSKLSKEPPPKKRRVMASPLKQRPQTTTAAVIGNRQFASPASPSVEPLVTSVKGIQTNQINDSHPSKGRARAERVAGPAPSIPKDKARISAPSAVVEGAKSGSATNLTDLRNFLIGFMQENPKGVTNKAIEKAVAEGLSGVADKRALEKVMKSVASFHAPGKYLLNAGVEKDSFKSGPPISLGRAREPEGPSIHEAELQNGSVGKEVLKEKNEASSSERISPIVKGGSPKYTGSQPLESNINNDDSTKWEAVHGSKDPRIGASDPSSSNASGSVSKNESDCSGGRSGTQSGSGSDSDLSIGSRGASMDEDVDIMSDNDGEKGKLLAKEKLKVGEPKLPTNEDRKIRGETYKDTNLNYNAGNPLPFMDAANGAQSLAKVPNNIMEAVFGSDETDDFGEDSCALIRDQPEVKSAESKYRDRKVHGKTQTSKGSKDSDFGNCHQMIITGDNEALEIAEDVDITVEKVSATNKQVRSVGGRKGNVSACQQEQAFLKSQGPSRENDKRRPDAENTCGSSQYRRDNDIYVSRDERPESKYCSSLEACTLPPKGSHWDKEECQAKTSLEKSYQAGTESRKTVSKTLHTKEVHDISERSNAAQSLVKRIPSNVARDAQRSANASEGKLDEERIDGLYDIGAVETSSFLETKPKKDKLTEERLLGESKIGEISSRQSRSFETQHLQHKDVVAPSKGNVYCASRERNYLTTSQDIDSPQSHKSSKVVKHSRQKADFLDRVGLVVEQAERPLEDWDSTRKGKDAHGKDCFNEVESVGRLQGGELSSVMAREAAHFGESGQSHGRSRLQGNCNASSQLPELSPHFGNGVPEPKKWPPSPEDSRGRTPAGTTNRFPHKGSSSPDEDDFQPLDRRLLDISRQSPVSVFEDSGHHACEARNTKGKAQEREIMELERSQRRAGVAQVKQAQHKGDRFHGGPGQQNHREKGSFIASQFENSGRSEEDTDEWCRRPKPTQAVSGDLRKDDLYPGDFLDKRHSPQSVPNEMEGCEFFAPYEKSKADLRGFINTYQQYKEYYKEYHEKYPIYVKLHGVIERHKKPFESLRKHMDWARSKEDEKKLVHTCAKVRREYFLHRKKRKRMFHTFRILHEELKVIKTRCKEYAEKFGQG